VDAFPFIPALRFRPGPVPFTLFPIQFPSRIRMTTFLPAPGSRSMRPVRSHRITAFDVRERSQFQPSPSAVIDAASIRPA
jgi:hypothetical protein